MFYFGLGNLSACEGLAVSDDLHHWKKFPAPILTIGKQGELDCTYAHKPGMIRLAPGKSASRTHKISFF